MTHTILNGEELSPEVLQWLQTAEFEHLACRDVRHAWPADRKTLWNWRDETRQGRRVYARHLQCTHGCGVTKNDWREFGTGNRLPSTYSYPKPLDGGRSLYLLPKGCGRLSSDDIFRFIMATQAPRAVRPPKSAPKNSTNTSTRRKPAQKKKVA